MSKVKEKPVYVVGHRNPDTDSVCSAICYANLKKKLTGKNYEARRAGALNEETSFVLKKFGVKSPELLSDVRAQVSDVEFNTMKGASADMSLKEAWEEMHKAETITMCITEGSQLKGLITTSDLVRPNMEAHDADLLAESKTSYRNIVNTLEGDMIEGDVSDVVTKGKVVIAAGTPDMMESYIDPGDIVILGNRFESQLCAIEMGAGCIVVCLGSEVTKTIRSQARNHGCRIISTPHDTFTVARLIGQSIPIGFYMKSDNLVSFHTTDFIEDVQQVMATLRHRYFPVLDEKDRFVGMISRRNILGAKRKKVILMDHNEKNQAVPGIETADVVEIIDHHRLGTVETIGPVMFRAQPLGSTCTIVALMYREHHVKPDKKVASLLLSAILSDTLMYRSPTCTPTDREVGDELAKISGIDVESFAKEMFKAGSNLGDKTPDEILHMDFKKFTINERNIGIGQVSSMAADELQEIGEKVAPELDNIISKDGLDMVFLMMTDILTESTCLLFAGKGAADLVEEGFDVSLKGTKEQTVNLPGVVSRKKQVLPAIVQAVQS